MKQRVRATVLSADSIDRFRIWLEATAKSKHTIKGYCTDLRMFILDLGGDVPEVLIDEEYEDLGMAWLTKHRRVLAPRTTSRRLTSLREFAKWAGFPGMLADYSAPDPGQPMPHPIPEGMDGVRRLIAATENERQRALVALGGFCGLRLSEALAVEYKHFTFLPDGRTMLTVRGKGEVTRHVPVTAEAMDVLLAPLARAMAGGVVVPLQDRFARRCITDLGVKAGLSRRIASHDLRATFATAVYDRTKNQRLVQMLLGHKSGRTTEGYIGIEYGQMQDAVDLL